jgi:hypothetical protein
MPQLIVTESTERRGSRPVFGHPLSKETETDITNSIRALLKTLDCFCWKQWQGPMSQPKGVSDIIGILTDEKTGHGIFLAIEVKRPGQKLRPDQEKFLQRVNDAGGIGFKAESVQDVIDRLGLQEHFISGGRAH